MRGVLDGSEQIDDQETDYWPHRFCRAHGSNRGHLCCRHCSAMVGRDDLCPCSARGHCSWHGRGHCRVSKFQHANSRLENSTSPSTRRDQKTRRDDPPPSGAAAKNTTASHQKGDACIGHFICEGGALRICEGGALRLAGKVHARFFKGGVYAEIIFASHLCDQGRRWRTRSTVFACHLPPAGVGTPRRLSSIAAAFADRSRSSISTGRNTFAR